MNDTERVIKIATAIRESDSTSGYCASGDTYWAVRAARVYIDRAHPSHVKLSELGPDQLQETLMSPEFSKEAALIVAIERLTEVMNRGGQR